MEKRQFVGLKIPPDLITAIDALAEAQGRTRSNMMEQILLGWIREHYPSLLPPPTPVVPVKKKKGGTGS